MNDVSGGTFDPHMLRTVAALRVPYCLMHMRGTPQTMTALATYSPDPVADVTAELGQRVAAAEAAGIHRWDLIVDPGIGFAKGLEHNLALLRGLRRLREGLGRLPVLVGVSRKRFIGTVRACLYVWWSGFVPLVGRGGANLTLTNKHHTYTYTHPTKSKTKPNQTKQICDEPDPAKRDPGTSVANALAIAEGAAAIRVHNVPMAVQAARLADAIARGVGK